MKRIICRTLPLTLSILVLLMAGCSQDKESAKEATTESAQQPVIADAVTETPALPVIADYQAAAKRANVRFNLPQWEQTTEQIDASTKTAITSIDTALDRIAAVNIETVNFENSVVALDKAFYPAIIVSERLDVIRESSQDKSLRDTAREASKRLQAAFIAASFRQDVYEVVKAYAATKPELTGEDVLLLNTTLRDYRRNGMELSQDKKDELKKLKTELNAMGLEFAKNINEAKADIIYTAAELDGVTDDFLSNKKIKMDDGNYKVQGNVTWQYLAVMENAKSEATRKKLLVARYRRAMESNTPLFTTMLKYRTKIAKLLGYQHWADYRIETKMAHNAKTAFDFLEALRVGLDGKYQQEIETLRQLKAADSSDADIPFYIWDRRYYENQLKKTKYNIDTEQLKVFFELERTLQGMFGIFEDIFALKIEEVQAPYKWVDDLRLYAVSDSGTGDPLGLIYMDMFPRDGKYNHFAQFGVTTGQIMDDGSYQRPVVALICNFPPATDSKPSLLSHDQVETLFHEFGHALHSVLTQTQYASFSGTSVPRDFVEAPSQMLENWVWDKSVLDRFAVDYRDSRTKISSKVLEQMDIARLATIASFYRRQLAFGIMDLKLHSRTDDKTFDDFITFSNNIMSDVALPVPADTGFVASFGHLGGGYDAGYYGYAWADAISADMAAIFKQSPGGLMDQSVGRRLRAEIYATGGARKIEDSIQAFLGRPRSLDAFYEHIGLNKEQDTP